MAWRPLVNGQERNCMFVYVQKRNPATIEVWRSWHSAAGKWTAVAANITNVAILVQSNRVYRIISGENTTVGRCFIQEAWRSAGVFDLRSKFLIHNKKERLASMGWLTATQRFRKTDIVWTVSDSFWFVFDFPPRPVNLSAFSSKASALRLARYNWVIWRNDDLGAFLWMLVS